MVAAGGLVNRHINARRVGWDVCVDTYRVDVKVYRNFRSQWGGSERVGGGLRESIVALSKPARRRMIFTARNLPQMPVWSTLTYPRSFPLNGRRVKRDLHVFERWLARRGVGGFWILEFQRRGAPHFHVWLTHRLPAAELSAAWYRIVASGDLKHLAAGTQIHAWDGAAPAAYAAKYASKMVQKQAPTGYEKVGRYWGVFGVSTKALCSYRGPLPDMAMSVRVIRAIYNSHRREWGRRRFEDNGRHGFTAYNSATAVLRWFDATV